MRHDRGGHGEGRHCGPAPKYPAHPARAAPEGHRTGDRGLGRSPSPSRAGVGTRCPPAFQGQLSGNGRGGKQRRSRWMPQGHSLPAVQSLGPPGGPRGASPAREPLGSEATLLGRTLPPAATLQRAGTKGLEPPQERAADPGGSTAGGGECGAEPAGSAVPAGGSGRKGAAEQPPPAGSRPARLTPPRPQPRCPLRCPREQHRHGPRRDPPRACAAAVLPHGGARRRWGGATAEPPANVASRSARRRRHGAPPAAPRPGPAAPPALPPAARRRRRPLRGHVRARPRAGWGRWERAREGPGGEIP